MSFISRISNTAALLLRAAQTTDDVEEADAPTLPPRLSTSHDPLALSTVFRGVQIIETAVSKLPLIQYAPDGSRMRPSTLITRPDLNRSRRDLFGDLVSALALNGNAFLLKVEAAGVLVGVRSLPPQLVTVTDLNMDPANPRLRYSYRGVDYGADRIVHLKLLNVAGRLRGMGPISAAREEIEGAQDTRAYASNWLDNTARPAGILKSDQILSDQDARTASERWAKGGAGGVRVLGKGLDYTHAVGVEPRRPAIHRVPAVQHHADSPPVGHPGVVDAREGGRHFADLLEHRARVAHVRGIHFVGLR